MINTGTKPRANYILDLDSKTICKHFIKYKCKKAVGEAI